MGFQIQCIFNHWESLIWLLQTANFCFFHYNFLLQPEMHYISPFLKTSPGSLSHRTRSKHHILEKNQSFHKWALIYFSSLILGRGRWQFSRWTLRKHQRGTLLFGLKMESQHFGNFLLKRAYLYAWFKGENFLNTRISKFRCY